MFTLRQMHDAKFTLMNIIISMLISYEKNLKFIFMFMHFVKR